MNVHVTVSPEESATSAVADASAVREPPDGSAQPRAVSVPGPAAVGFSVSRYVPSARPVTECSVEPAPSWNGAPAPA